MELNSQLANAELRLVGNLVALGTMATKHLN